MATINPFTQQDGFFSVADITRQGFEKNKRKQRLQEFGQTIDKAAAGLKPQDRAIFGAFAQLGGSLGNKIAGENPDAITPDEERSFAIMDAFNTDMRDLKTSPDFQALDPTEQSYKVQQLMADKSAEAGDYDSYTQIAQDLMQKKIANRTAAAQAARLEGQVADDATRRPVLEATADAELAKLAQGNPVQMVRTVNGKPDLTAAVTVRQLPDGSYVDADTGEAVPFNEVMLLDDAMSLSEATTSGDTVGERFGNLATQTGVKAMGQLRQGISDIDNTIGVTERIAEAFVNATDPQQIVGTAGGLLGFANNVANALQGTAKNVGFFSEVGPDGKPVAGAKKFTLSDADDFIDDDMVPPQFASNAESALQYKSAVMQLVYADARLEEPGARQLSDADIKNAMDRLGVSSGDPASVLSNLQSVMNNRLNVQQSRYERFGNRAEAMGIPRQEAFQRGFGTDPVERINQGRESFRTAFSRGQEAAGAPSAVVDDSTLAPEEADLLNNILNR